MLSIFIMYSTDRKAQLEMVFECLQAMPRFPQCQKTLVVDGKLNGHFPDWEAIEVPRIADRFCWANMWNAGVATARYPIIWYLDSDRLLPTYYLDLLISQVKDNLFVFTSWHHNVKVDIGLNTCREFLKEEVASACPSLFLDPRYLGKIWFEQRSRTPNNRPGKNVMSGNTAFTKSTYLKLRGVDPWYCGHGAFADTDFHTHAMQAGCQFMDLMVPEVHYHHTKLNQDGRPHEQKEISRLSLDNYIYYCFKWGLPISLAESMAAKIEIPKPKNYVSEKLEAIKKELSCER